MLAHRLPAAHSSGARDPSPVKPKACALPSYHRPRCNQDERLFPAGPEPSQDDPERFVPCSDAVARSFAVPGEPLLTERQVFQEQFLAGTEDANDPADEVPEHGDHRGKSYRKDNRTLHCKSIILRGRKVLTSHSGSPDFSSVIMRMQGWQWAP